jgi:hypothetical protein
MVDSTYLIEVYRPQQRRKLPNAQKNRQVASIADLIVAGGGVSKTGDTMTGPLTILDSNATGKLWLARYNSGTGHNNQPTDIGPDTTYLFIGGREFSLNGKRGIGFGYVQSMAQHSPVWVGMEEKETSGQSYGDFIVATRAVATDTAPTVKFRVTGLDGQIVAEDPAYVPSTNQSLTDKKYVDALVATAIPLTQKGAAGGVASLDGSGKISASELPPLDHDVGRAATQAEMLALVVTAPAVCIRTDFNPPHVFYLTADPATTLANWVDTGEFGAGGANPSALAGMAAINGVAATFMRSDGAPAINPAIAPTWTAKHIFSHVGGSADPSVSIASTSPVLEISHTAGGADAKKWNWLATANRIAFRAINDAGSVASEAWGIDRVAGAVTQQDWSVGGVSKATLLAAGLGIGTQTPHAPLQFSNALVNRKIVMFEGANNDHQFDGFGVTANVMRYQGNATTLDHVFYAATGPAASNELFRIRGAGGALSSAEIDVIQNVAGIKARLAMKIPGTQNDAPTTFGIAATYLGIGGGEWNANSYRLIGFGYIAALGNQYPAVMGYQETSTTTNTRGDLVMGARPNNNNEAPPILFRIRSDGQLLAESATYVPAAAKSLVTKDYVDSPVFPQPAPTATTGTGPLTAAELLTGLIVGTPVAAAVYTLPLGTALEAALLAAHPGLAVGDAFDFNVINLGAAAFTITLATAAGWTLSGQMVVQDGSAVGNRSAAKFRARRTAANAYTLYRVA